MNNLKILVLQPDFSRYQAAYYQHQFTQALGRAHRIFRYGPRMEGYDPSHTIEDVLKSCPFDPDLICFGAGWENEHESIPEYDPHPAIQVADLSIPSVMVLNKEYKKLDRKFEFIVKNNIQAVFTAHHKYKDWTEQVGVPFIHFPFAVNEGLFKDYGEKKKYALGFSGELHKRWVDVRSQIKDRLFLKWPIKAPRYWKTRLLWIERGRMNGFRLPQGEEYARLINRCEAWLATPSAVDIVGPRFYEVIASKTLLFCSRSDAYEGLFEDDVHCAMFEPDLSDFDDRLFHYLNHEDKRRAVVESAYAHVLENHTWERRIEQFTEAVRRIC